MGTGIGVALGQRKSRETAEYSHIKEMTTDGAIAGSLGSMTLALCGAKLMKSAYADIKHRNETPIESKARETKKEIKKIKTEIEFLKTIAGSEKSSSAVKRIAQDKTIKLEEKLTAFMGDKSQGVMEDIHNKNEELVK